MDFAFEHVLDEHAALGNISVDGEVLLIRCNEDNHNSRERTGGKLYGEVDEEVEGEEKEGCYHATSRVT